MPDVVALDLHAGPRFVDALAAVWRDGDAALPVDQRLPHEAKRRLLDRLRPTAVIDEQGRRPRGQGVAALPGDALVVATSGTTGDPKGAILTHEAVRRSAMATSHALDATPADRWLACLPVAHIGGLSVITRALITGVPLTVHAGFDAARVRNAAHEGCSLVSLVPAAARRVDLAAFRKVLLGGSVIPARRPPNCIATYGMTETGSGVVYDGWPLDEVELRVVDEEIQVRGPMLLRAYRADTPEGDDPKRDGWFATGDTGAIDGTGRLTVYGRRGDVIVTGGEKVWPAQVERALADLDTIDSVVVYGRPDAEWGSVVVARVTQADARPVTLDDLRNHVKQTLPAYCAPRVLEVVDRIETTALGKPRRPRPGPAAP